MPQPGQVSKGETMASDERRAGEREAFYGPQYAGPASVQVDGAASPGAVTTLHGWAAAEAVCMLLECVEPNHPETARARAELQYVQEYISVSHILLSRCLAYLEACENPTANLTETIRLLDSLLAPAGEKSFLAWARNQVAAEAYRRAGQKGGK